MTEPREPSPKKTVTIIPAKQCTQATDGRKHGPLRVAAYCRVSTDDEEQITSYKNQIAHYTDRINSNPGWTLAGIFADEGITGTSTRKRTEFNKLIALCKRGKVDIILTKSTSRFARNTLDCLKYTRMLKELGVAVIFEKENINTATMNSELILSFYGSFAQAESESLSKNVALGNRYGFKQGRVRINYTYLLGYRKGADGQPEIIPEEAVVIRRIFHSFLAGYSIGRIKAELEQDGIRSVTQKGQWSRSVIAGILRNEKYIGDALLQKTYVTDCISKKVKKNNGELPQYYVKDNHPAIIERTVFNQVQEEFARRNSKPKASQKPTKTNLGKFSSKYALTELLYCGECGTPYRRTTWTRNGQKKIVWRCISRLENGRAMCKDSPTIPEAELHDAILRGFRLLAAQQNEIHTGLQEALYTAVSGQDGDSPETIDNMIAEQDERRSKLIEKMVKAGADESHYIAELTMIANAVNTLRLRKADMERDALNHETAEARLAVMRERLNDADLSLDDYDDILVRQAVESVKVLSRNKILIRFKVGIEMTIELKPAE